MRPFFVARPCLVCLACVASTVCVACVDPAPPTPPKVSTATAPPASSVWPGTLVIDAAVIADTPEAGSASACVPHTIVADGDVEQVGVSKAGDALAFCLSYARAMPEAPSGRACYSASLASGIYDRIPPSPPREERVAPDAVGRKLAEHPSGTGAYVVKATDATVTACKKGTNECVSVRVDKGSAPHKDAGACLPDALAKSVPADVSPDGSSIFAVRHETCDGRQIFGEVYDVKKKARTARFPLRADAYVTLALWLGPRVLIRACGSLVEECTLSLVDPKTGSAAPIAGVNAWGADEFAFRATGDVWAFVDRAGQRVVWARADDGKIERRLDIAFGAPELRFRAAFGRRDDKQLYILHGGTGRVLLVDLTSGEVAQNWQPPVCGEHPRGT